MADLLTSLQKSGLVAQCPRCQNEFQLSKAGLFDGTQLFPVKAEEKKLSMLAELDVLKEQIKEREADLKKILKEGPKRSERSAVSSNLGTIMQNLLPYNKEFNKNIPMTDSRFLSQQLDIIVFHGASQNDVKRISFMDAKTGKTGLEPNQKQIREIVKNGKVKSELY